MITFVKTIMLVSQNPMISNQLINILTKFDYSILVRKPHLNSILKAVKEYYIYSVIFDLKMVDDSIINMINIIKEKKPLLPIIIFSKQGNEIDTIRKLKEKGIYYYGITSLQNTDFENIIKGLNKYYKKFKQTEL